MNEIMPKSRRAVSFLEQEDAVHEDRRFESVSEAPSFRDYWLVVRKHQWKILACLVSAVIISGIIVFTTTPIYVAKATLMIERKAPQVVKIQQVIGETDEADESSFYESQYQVLQSRSLAAAVIKAQKLDKDAAFLKQSESGFSLGQLLSMPIAWLQSLLPQASANIPAVVHCGYRFGDYQQLFRHGQHRAGQAQPHCSDRYQLAES